MDRFPLPSTVRYAYARNWEPGEKGHKGTDIFAPRNAPVVAVSSGVARRATETKGGRAVYLRTPQGVEYYYAHLASWSAKLQSADSVEVDEGDVLGAVGTSGNAAGRPPHLHFQVKEDGKTIDPFDLLRAVDVNRGKSIQPSSEGPQWGKLAWAVLWWLLTKA